MTTQAGDPVPQPGGTNPVEKWQQLRAAALATIERLKRGEAVERDAAISLAERLRDEREFDLLNTLTDQLRRRGHNDPTLRRLQAQSLIDQGDPISATDVLEALIARLPKDSREWGEAHGLLGRAFKQMFFDAADKTGAQARDALDTAIREYRIPYVETGNPWHGVNLVALASFARAQNLPVEVEIDIAAVARNVVETLNAGTNRDSWFYASLAEAHLALGDLDAVEANIKQYVTDPQTTAFALAGTLRQFRDLWLMDKKGPRENAIVQALSGALMSKDYGRLELTPGQVRQWNDEPPSADQFQALLGADGPKTLEWVKLGIKCAEAIGVISRGPTVRAGTGFLVRARDFNPEWPDELVVLTNAHVVSDDRADGAMRGGEAFIRFEAVDPPKRCKVDRVVWSSPKTKLDASILRLADKVEGIVPLDFAQWLPTLDGKRRVNVIGHPGGRDLAFSFQDNLLLDHEGPDEGKPVDPAICHLHYRAPTEKGSSGSPVFDGDLWTVIALHHAGGAAMRRLNGRTETWPANEGVWIQSIIAAAAASPWSAGAAPR